MVFIEIGLYLWGLFKLWITALFVSPFHHKEMLWLLIPIWITWFFAEFFQEKQGTSMGNAITNAVIVLWGSIDCSRQTVRLLVDGTIIGFMNIFSRFFLVAILFGYGIAIVILGLKGKKIIKYIGRIREVTYVFAIFAPIFYNHMVLQLSHIIAAVLFFPLFYFIIELIDRYAPNPKAVEEDINDKGDSIHTDNGFGSSNGIGNSNEFGSSSGIGNSDSLNNKMGISSGESGINNGKKDDISNFKF